MRGTFHSQDLKHALPPGDMCFAAALAKLDMDHLDMRIILLWLPAITCSLLLLRANVDYLQLRKVQA